MKSIIGFKLKFDNNPSDEILALNALNYSEIKKDGNGYYYAGSGFYEPYVQKFRLNEAIKITNGTRVFTCFSCKQLIGVTKENFELFYQNYSAFRLVCDECSHNEVKLK